MPSFRSPQKQAANAVSKRMATGTARHENKEDGKVHSLGSARTQTERLTQTAQWLTAQRQNLSLRDLTPELAQAYLAHRSTQVCQKTLDLDRQALQAQLGQKLDRVKTDRPTTGHGDESRAYTPAQIELIKAELSSQEQLAVAIVAAAGIRAHELNTLRPADDRGPSSHRSWREDRFSGLPGERYTVAGKGGLVREVILPANLATQLETVRKDTVKTDRGIHYAARYDLPSGKTLSTAFGEASKEALGWSVGLHGLRHSYAQERLETLQHSGKRFDDAKEIISQELGHFRSDITEVYLR